MRILKETKIDGMEESFRKKTVVEMKKAKKEPRREKIGIHLV